MSSKNTPQPVETLPEDRSELFAKIEFTPNLGDRKSPSQSAGELHERFANLPQSKELLFSTSFKGNDGKWWKLIDRVGSWAWIPDKSASTPSSSTSSQSFDERIEYLLSIFEKSGKKLEFLPSYIQELALRNQEKEGGKRDKNKDLGAAFFWDKSNEGNDFWAAVFNGEWTSRKVLGIVGPKEKLFEKPVALIPTKTIDERIEDQIERFVSNWLIKNLPPYVKELALRIQEKEKGSRNENIKLDLAFTFNTTSQGFDFWDKIKNSKWTSDEVLAIVGSKENLFEMPPAQSQPTTQPTTPTNKNDIGPIIGLENVKFSTGGSENVSMAFQLLVFQLGCEWGSGGKQVKHKNDPFLYIGKNKIISKGTSKSFFDSDESKEITIEQLKAQVTLKTTSNSMLGPDVTKEDVKFDSTGNKESFKEFQELIFQLGFEWPKFPGGGGQTLIVDDGPYIYTIKDKKEIVWSENEVAFNDSPNKQITIEQLRAQVATLKSAINIDDLAEELSKKIILEISSDNIYYINNQLKTGDNEITFGLAKLENKNFYGPEDSDEYWSFNSEQISNLLDGEVTDGYRVLTDKEIQPFGKGTDISIDDFLHLNNPLISTMKQTTPEVFDAFTDIMNELVKKYPGNVKSQIKVVMPEPLKKEHNTIDDRIDKQLKLFNGNKIISNLPPYLKEMALQWQELQFKTRNETMRVDSDLYGGEFWKAVNDGKWTSDEVLEAVGSKEKLFEMPPMSIKDKVKEAINKFIEESTYANLPPYLKELALRNQENQGNSRNENSTLMDGKKNGGFDFSDSIEGKYFWEAILLGNWTMDVVMNKIPGTLETLFEMPAPVSSQQSKPVKTKEWTPQDLVGKYIAKGSEIYFVAKLARNNPKNKRYEMYLTSTNRKTEWNVGMGAVTQLLDGKTLQGTYKIVDDPKKTTPSATTPTPQPTKTKDPNDYSTWPQAALVGKLQEIKEALQYLDEEDDEYIELKAKMNTIELFID